MIASSAWCHVLSPKSGLSTPRPVLEWGELDQIRSLQSGSKVTQRLHKKESPDLSLNIKDPGMSASSCTARATF